MMLATIADITTGLVTVVGSFAVLLILANSFPAVILKIRAQRDPARETNRLQATFDWCWLLSVLVVVSHVHGLLWFLNAIRMTPGFMLAEFIDENWIAPAMLLVTYIIIAIATRTPQPSKLALILTAVIVVLGSGLGFLISGGLVATVDPDVLVGVFGSNNPLHPGELVSIYAVMGLFLAPDFLIYVFVVNMLPLAFGYGICQIIAGIVTLVKHLVARRARRGAYSATPSGKEAPMPSPME